MSDKDKGKNDNLESAEAIPEHISCETSHKSIRQAKDSQGSHPDGDDFGEADTDRVDYSDGDTQDTGVLAIASEVPLVFSLRLHPISSTLNMCFFCGEMDCELTFVAKSPIRGKTTAYAAHTACVIDHERLQRLGSVEF